MNSNCDDDHVGDDVFQERHCLTWKTDIIDHKVREINFGSFKFILEIQPKICHSMVYIFLYDKGQSNATFDIKTYLLNKEKKEEFEQLYKGSLEHGPTIWSMKRDELLKNENICESRKLKFGFEISPVVVKLRQNDGTCIVKEECYTISENDEKDKIERLWKIAQFLSDNSTTSITKDDLAGISQEKEINPPSLEMMSLDFSKLFDNEEGSDVVLKCGERQIKAHRYILSARSDVFAAMFRSGMLESQEGVVTIEDMDAEILEQMLRYMYSGKVGELTVETASKLYKASDEYSIASLRVLCVAFLTENLSQISVCDVLLLANTYSDKELESAAIHFMSKNGASLCTDQWDMFCEEHPSLGIKVYRKYVQKQPHGNTLRFKPY